MERNGTYRQGSDARSQESGWRGARETQQPVAAGGVRASSRSSHLSTPSPASARSRVASAPTVLPAQAHTGLSFQPATACSAPPQHCHLLSPVPKVGKVRIL